MGSKKAADIVELAAARERRAEGAEPGEPSIAEAAGTGEHTAAPEAVANDDSSPRTDHEAPDPSLEDQAAAVDPSTLKGLDTAGDMLKAAREAFGLSIEDVAAQTNIPARRVALIEAVDVKNLPSMPFTLGFVRAYAQLLNLPADALVARFRADAGYPPADQIPTLKPALKDDLGPPAQVNILAVLGIVAFIVWMVWQILQSVAPTQVADVEGTPLSGRIQTDTGVTYEVDTSVAEDGVLVADVPVAPSSEGASALRTEAASVAAAAIRNGAPDGATRTVDGDGIAIVYTDEVATLDEDTLAESVPLEVTAPEDSAAARLNAQALARLSQDLSEAPEEERATGLSPTAPQAVEDTVSLTQANGEGGSPPPAGESANAVTASEGVVADPASSRIPPEVRLMVEPVYPTRCESRAAEQETVTVTFNVSRYGKVSSPEVASSTNDCFDRAALAAVARWDFSPAQENGRAVASDGRTTRVIFRRPQ